MRGRPRRERKCKDCGTTDEPRFRVTVRSRCRRCETIARRTPEYTGPSPRNHREGCHCRYCGETHGQPSGEDLTKLAERTLYPETPYERMTRDQRIACSEWAMCEAVRRGLLTARAGPIKRPVLGRKVAA